MVTIVQANILGALTFDLACRWAFRWAKVRSKYRLTKLSWTLV